jgi:RNA polymerase sigma factor (sigma-70 family)
VHGRPADLGDGELVERARRGDVGAYEGLVERYQDLAYRAAYLVTGSAADAEDAAQEGFVKAYYALGRFRAGAPFRPWLLAIVANEARNRRRSARRQESLAVWVAEGGASGQAGPSPEVAALATARRAALLAVVNRLPEPDREVLACRYFLELSETETASALGCRLGTVKSRTARALTRLRALLTQEGLQGRLGPEMLERGGE